MDVFAIFQWLQANLNYGTITLLMAIESSFIPLPSEVIVPPAAYFAMHNGNLNIYLVVAFATIGALIGAIINYNLALWIGRPIVYRFANSRVGNMLLLNGDKIQKAELYFDKHGAISTFIGRLIPAIRHLISIPAGLAKMNFGVFVIFTSLGAAVWNGVLAYLGYWLSLFVPQDQLMNKIEYYNYYLTIGGYIFGVLVLVFVLFQVFRKKLIKA